MLCDRRPNCHLGASERGPAIGMDDSDRVDFSRRMIRQMLHLIQLDYDWGGTVSNARPLMREPCGLD